MYMPFGKHAGERLTDIPADYLRWVSDNLDNLETGLREAIENELWEREREHRTVATVQPSLPFGRHRGQPLPDVPTPYLTWLLTCKLSTGLRATVTGELERRGEQVPPAPVPAPPTCPRCGGTELRLHWRTFKDDRRMIARRCGRCKAHLGFAAQVPENIALADAAVGSELPDRFTTVIAFTAFAG